MQRGVWGPRKSHLGVCGCWMPEPRLTQLLATAVASLPASPPCLPAVAKAIPSAWKSYQVFFI